MDDKAERAQERADFKRMWKSVMDLGALVYLHALQEKRIGSICLGVGTLVVVS